MVGRRYLIPCVVVVLLAVCGAAEAQDAFAGVWRAGNDGYYLWVGSTWTDFEAKWKELSAKNLRLVDLDVYRDGNQLKFNGVWRAGSDAHYLWVGQEWDGFRAKWEELAKQNLRLTVIRSWVDGGKRKYAGVWRAGNDAHYLWAGVDWNNFHAKWQELSGKGLRLVDFESYAEGNTRKYIGVWRAGNDAHFLWVGVDWNNFRAKWEELAKQNLRLTVIDTYVEGGQRKYSGVWRAGSDGYYLWAGVDYESLVGKWHELASQGLRLVNLVTYPGCGSCANHVVSPKGYDYGITGHQTYYRAVVVDGANQYVRHSALQFKGAPFVLPFSDTSVKRGNGWLYKEGDWHHAHDYSASGGATFEVRAAAAGKVIFIGWDNWSGNTIVVSHRVNGVDDAFRTIYMHLRNGASGDCANAWSKSVPSIAADTADDHSKSDYKAYLGASGCTEAVATRNPASVNWGTSSHTIPVAVNQQVTAGQMLAWAGQTGPGGGRSPSGSNNTHLHIFFTVKDPTDNRFYFIDPYGIYSIPSCYPAATTGATGTCARYPIAWKGGTPQYP